MHGMGSLTKRKKWKRMNTDIANAIGNMNATIHSLTNVATLAGLCLTRGTDK